MFPAMPYVPELPRCETCGGPASHFYVDLDEIDPIGPRQSLDVHGHPIEVWDRQWKVRARHARCDTHQAEASRYFQDGTLEVGGRPLGRWK